MKLIATLGLALLAVCAVAAEPPLSIAVFDFRTPAGTSEDLGKQVATLISAQLSSDPALVVVERAELDKALGEQELGLSGTISSETAAKVGHLTGAKVLVTGQVIPAGQETILVAKVIGTETSRVFGLTARMESGASPAGASGTLGKEVAATAMKNAAALIAKPETPEERLARIRAMMKAGPLPMVSVHIPEQHFGRPVIDPAAETELSLTLQQLGFQVVDEKSGQKAEIAVEGEAFSELALRRGNLVSCKARLEIKVRRLATGEILSVDRQVSAAVDLSEHIAAKSALANAAREIAPRVVAKLAK